eukprot:783287-Rhodomonas_salina.1
MERVPQYSVDERFRALATRTSHSTCTGQYAHASLRGHWRLVSGNHLCFDLLRSEYKLEIARYLARSRQHGRGLLRYQHAQVMAVIRCQAYQPARSGQVVCRKVSVFYRLYIVYRGAMRSRMKRPCASSGSLLLPAPRIHVLSITSIYPVSLRARAFHLVSAGLAV